MLLDIESRSEKIAATRSGRVNVWEKYFTEDVRKSYRAKADEAVTLTGGTKYAEAAELFANYFSGISPMLRGSFHQPDVFGHIYFMK